MRSHSVAASEFIEDRERTNWHNETLWWVRAKRDKASKAIPEWEDLREQASQIKNYTLDHLGELLLQFEQNAIQNGIKVHWAADAKEHNQIVHAIIAQKGVTQLVKSKSMLTEECHLNEYLAEKGIDVVDIGGTFCVTEEAVSVKMGQDRVHEHEENNVEYIVGADSSCLMHLEGILKRKRSKVQVKHVVEILNHA